MAINKIVQTLEEAVSGFFDGATVLVSGFGEAGSPTALLEALSLQGLKGLTIVSNNAGSGDTGLARLISGGSVKKLICSYPKPPGSERFGELYLRGEIELELTPQGTLSERIRAGGAGIGGFFTRTGADTQLAEGREIREIDGDLYVFESPIRADFALMRAYQADRWGNLTFRRTARNFGPTMAAAANVSIAQVAEVVPLGQLDPEQIVTPGILIDRAIRIAA